ncbi:hypothetical protein EMGR_003040, partial [Emarellia grisea]
MPTRLANALRQTSRKALCEWLREGLPKRLRKPARMAVRDPRITECAERGEDSTMALHIRDPEADRLVRMRAERKGIALTDALKLAVGNPLRRDAETLSL